MRIGLVYDLRLDYLNMGYSLEETAEFDSEDTIYNLSVTLESLGHTVERVGNIFNLIRCLNAGKRWDLVFNISEGMYGRSREAQVPAILEAFDIPYTFSDPLTLALSLDKGITKRVIRDAGVPTPDFFVVKDLEELDKALSEGKLAYPLFVKPLAEGTGKGVTAKSIIRSDEAFREQCVALLKKNGTPVLVETFLPGREVTVGIAGTGENARVLGVLDICLLENADADVYTYENKELCEERIEYRLVREEAVIREASEIALKSYRALECRDAGRVDLRQDEEGRFSFIEINPLAGLNPAHSDLPILANLAGVQYQQLIGMIVDSAMERRKTPLQNEEETVDGSVADSLALKLERENRRFEVA